MEFSPLTKEELVESLSEFDGEILLADGFEEAYLGILQRCGQPPHAIYDRAKCIRILVDRDGMSPDETEECFTHNTESSWVGPTTPGFVWKPCS